MLLKSLNFFSLLLQKNNLIDIFIKYFFVAIIAFGVDAGVLSVSVRFLGSLGGLRVFGWCGSKLLLDC